MLQWDKRHCLIFCTNLLLVEMASKHAENEAVVCRKSDSAVNLVGWALAFRHGAAAQLIRVTLWLLFMRDGAGSRSCMLSSK